MLHPDNLLSRRDLAGRCLAAAGVTLVTGFGASSNPAPVAITLDLEMSRHYPTWDDTHWDFEKGNLDDATKRYAVEAARRVKRRGGVIHFFAVGRVLEQENVDWLREIHDAGHPVGNHTYDHVNVKATEPGQVQFRFRRAPWLIEGKRPAEVIAENVAMTSRALKQRLGFSPKGFRTPGGFNNGLRDRPDVQSMLLKQGFSWVSSLYPAHPLGKPGSPPTREALDAIVKAQSEAQPFVYPSGLVEVPMSPVSDVTSMRSGRWPLEAFLEAIRLGLSRAIEHGMAYDFLAHPSCLVVTDPKFRAIDLICDIVERSKGRAALSDLGAIAFRAGKTS
jgi:peptidoglycan/xylan/chitin deacetylase (PgdA/CDA1 family)